jgi:hypothetical protein
VKQSSLSVSWGVVNDSFKRPRGRADHPSEAAQAPGLWAGRLRPPPTARLAGRLDAVGDVRPYCGHPRPSAHDDVYGVARAAYDGREADTMRSSPGPHLSMRKGAVQPWVGVSADRLDGFGQIIVQRTRRGSCATPPAPVDAWAPARDTTGILGHPSQRRIPCKRRITVAWPRCD